MESGVGADVVESGVVESGVGALSSSAEEEEM